MRKLAATVLFLSAATLAVVAVHPDGAVAEGRRAPTCSLESLAGRWFFATDVGQFPDFGGDITAIGTIDLRRDGRVSGRFDATIALTGFLPGNSYEGSMVVHRDCTGTLTFQTSENTSRTDSIVIVSRREIWGMSQDPANLWTYRARKVGPGLDD